MDSPMTQFQPPMEHKRASALWIILALVVLAAAGFAYWKFYSRQIPPAIQENIQPPPPQAADASISPDNDSNARIGQELNATQSADLEAEFKDVDQERHGL